MVSYDPTQITLYLALVVTMAALGVALVLATLVEAVVCHRRVRLDRRESLCSYYGNLALHH